MKYTLRIHEHDSEMVEVFAKRKHGTNLVCVMHVEMSFDMDDTELYDVLQREGEVEVVMTLSEKNHG